MPYFVCQDEECGHRFFDRSALALMSGCPACADGEVALEEVEPEATPASARTMRERKDDCRTEAKRLLARYGITEPPVDVERIAYGAGLRIVRCKLAGDGLLEGHTIKVNAEHASTRQRFTIAHEIAHFVLHADGTDENSEREADAFAGSLLIPLEMLRREVTRTSDVEVLRRRFNVSREALWIGLKQARLEGKLE